MSDPSQRVLGGGYNVKGAMQSLINGLKNIPMKALRRWNKTFDDINNKRLYDNERSGKLLSELEKFQRRTPKEYVDRCIGFIFASPRC